MAQEKLQAQKKREEIAKQKNKERMEREEARRREQQEQEQLKRQKEMEEQERKAAQEEKRQQALRRKEAIAGLKKPAKSVATGQTFLETLDEIETTEQQNQEKLDAKLTRLKTRVADHVQRVHTLHTGGQRGKLPHQRLAGEDDSKYSQ